MNRRLIAAALLTVLTVLGGIDLLEDTGLIHYSTMEMNRSLEDVLDNYGEAIRSAENVRTSYADLSARATGYYGSISQQLVSGNLAYILRRKQNLDFAESAFNPLRYSQVLLV
jgi:hypothetical protein